MRRPSHLWPWLVIAGALTLFMISSAMRADMQTLGNLSSSRPLLPDLLALPAYALLAAGLLGFSRRSTRTPLRQSSLVLDGAIAALAVASLAWVFAIQPLLARQDAPLSVVLHPRGLPLALRVHGGGHAAHRVQIPSRTWCRPSGSCSRVCR